MLLDEWWNVFYFVCCLGYVGGEILHARKIRSEIGRAKSMDSKELYSYAKELIVSFQLLQKTVELGRLPVVNFAAGGLGKCRALKFKKLRKC